MRHPLFLKTSKDFSALDSLNFLKRNKTSYILRNSFKKKSDSFNSMKHDASSLVSKENLSHFRSKKYNNNFDYINSCNSTSKIKGRKQIISFIKHPLYLLYEQEIKKQLIKMKKNSTNISNILSSVDDKIYKIDSNIKQSTSHLSSELLKSITRQSFFPKKNYSNNISKTNWGKKTQINILDKPHTLFDSCDTPMYINKMNLNYKFAYPLKQQYKKSDDSKVFKKRKVKGEINKELNKYSIRVFDDLNKLEQLQKIKVIIHNKIY